MRMTFLLVACACAGLISAVAVSAREAVPGRITVETRDGWFYVNGERFFVKGINYGGWRPGQSPGDNDPVDPAQADRDFAAIRGAGFNTIRTAGGLTPALLSLARARGLMVMHGIWFDGDMDYADPERTAEACGMLAEDLKGSKDFDNVLCYLVMNEPRPERVAQAGREKTRAFLNQLVETVRGQTGRPVSFASWIPLAALDHPFVDCACFNLYEWGPVTVSHTLGYEGCVRWLKRTHAQSRPLVITEFGASVSPRGVKQPWSLTGYGGNTVTGQRDAILRMYDDLISAGAAGACVFSWDDSWWMTGSKEIQDDNPEEYFGITRFDRAGRTVARPAFAALAEYHKAMVISPGRRVAGIAAEARIYTELAPDTVECRIAGRPWQRLRREDGSWWTGTIALAGLAPGSHELEARLIKDGRRRAAVRRSVLVTGEAPVPRVVSVATDKDAYQPGERITAVVSVTGPDGTPAAGLRCAYSAFFTDGWQEYGWEGITDNEGKITRRFPASGTGMVVVAATVSGARGTDSTERPGALTSAFIGHRREVAP